MVYKVVFLKSLFNRISIFYKMSYKIGQLGIKEYNTLQTTFTQK